MKQYAWTALTDSICIFLVSNFCDCLSNHNNDWLRVEINGLRNTISAISNVQKKGIEW